MCMNLDTKVNHEVSQIIDMHKIELVFSLSSLFPLSNS